MLTTAMALAAAATTLQPSGKWVVDFADNACVLSRQYDNSDKRFTLHFKAPLIGNQFEILITTPDNSSRDPTYDKGWIEKPDGRRVGPVHVLSFSTVSKHRLSRIYIDPDLYVLGEDGERLNLHVNAKRSYDLALPHFKNAMSVLDFCLKDLRKVYGVDDAVMAKIVSPAAPMRPVVRLFSTDDYPAGELSAGGQGTVGVLYWVERDGRVRNCTVIDTSHRAGLDKMTCSIIVERSRFKPALDAEGKPIRSPGFIRIRWEVAN